MRFIKDGPDIPNELILSQEKGDTVFFCGAGISYYLGLPSFEKLTRNVFDKLGIDFKEEVSKADIEGGSFDRILGALENSIRGNSSRVDDRFRKTIKSILTVDKSKDCHLHKALIDLAKENDENKIRLVTTNFDNAFELARSDKDISINKAPYIYHIPKKEIFNDLVYLHGLCQTENEDCGKIVVTSADFGEA